MLDKVKELLGSIRFWVVTFGWASEYLAQVTADGFDLPVLFTRVSVWLASVAAIGTFDSIAVKFGSALRK